MRMQAVYRYSKVLAIVVACCGLWAGSASAQTLAPTAPTAWSEQCGDQSRKTYSATVQAPAGDYDVYVHLTKAGAQADAAVYQQEYLQQCVAIGSGRASGDRWQHVGVWRVAVPESFGRFYVSTPFEADALTINRPKLMLVSRQQPACMPTDACRVTVQDELGEVQPRPATTAQESLAVVRVVPPQDDTLLTVDYYVNNRPVYATATLERFDTRYVGSGSHRLTRVAVYKSGQRVVFEEEINQPWTNQLRYLVYSFVLGNRTWLQWAGLVAVAVAFEWAALLVAQRLYRRHLWRVHHFVQKARHSTAAGDPSAPAAFHYAKPEIPLVNLMRLVMPYLAGLALLVGVVAVAELYLVQITAVDGVSMSRTLESGQHVAVSRIDVMLARLSSKRYIPDYGAVVVFENAQDPLSMATPGSERVLIKRVIGLPGDTVRIRNGTITVINDAHPKGFQPDAGKLWSSTIIPVPPEQDIEVTVGPGQVFVCGDNRPQSTDSRTFGPITADTIIGRALVRLSPFTKL